MHNKEIYQLEDMPDHPENLLFADERKNDFKLRDRNIKRCLFIRLRLKGAEIRDVRFEHCVFEDCYLRRASFHNVDFTGSFFKDCNLERVSFEGVRLWYVRFLRCRLNYKEILGSIPVEPNIAMGVLKSARQNAIAMGEKEIADKILKKEIELEKKELLNRYRGELSYYKKRYRGWDRWVSLCKYGSLYLEGWVWGHGLKLWNLFGTALVVIVIFACLFCGLGFFSQGGACADIGFFDGFYLSVATFTTLGCPDYITASVVGRVICGLESFLGVVFLGFLAAAVYRKFSR